MSQLIRSRWRYRESSENIASLFDALGIEYQRREGQGFWEANAPILRELYQELQSEAREKFRELHPDTGGDGDEFAAFLEAVTAARRRFAYHLPTDLSAPTTLEAPTATREFQCGAQCPTNEQRLGLLKPEKFKCAAAMLAEGENATRVAKRVGLSRTTVNKIKKDMFARGYIFKGCACGRLAGHRGNCAHRNRRIEGRDEQLRRFIEGGIKTRITRESRHLFNRWAKHSRPFVAAA